MRPFVPEGGFLIECHKEFTREVSVIADDPIQRVSVDMNIEGGHEDADLYSVLFEVFALVNLLDKNDLAICRSDDEFIPRRCHTVRVTEEIQRKKEEDKEESDQPEFHDLRIDEEPTERGARNHNEQNDADDIIPVLGDQKTLLLVDSAHKMSTSQA